MLYCMLSRVLCCCHVVVVTECARGRALEGTRRASFGEFRYNAIAATAALSGKEDVVYSISHVPACFVFFVIKFYVLFQFLFAIV